MTDKEARLAEEEMQKAEEHAGRFEGRRGDPPPP